MSITPLTGMPPLPVPVLPESFDLSLSYMELLTKCWNQVATLTTTCNSLLQRVTQIEQLIDDVPDLASAVQQLQGDVEQLQLDLSAETQARSDGYDTLYNQINQVRALVLNEYVDNETFDAALGGGIRFMLITKAAYDELDPPDPAVIYFVQDGDALTPYYRGGVVNSSAGAFSRGARSVTAAPVNFTTEG